MIADAKRSGEEEEEEDVLSTPADRTGQDGEASIGRCTVLRLDFYYGRHSSLHLHLLRSSPQVSGVSFESLTFQGLCLCH